MISSLRQPLHVLTSDEKSMRELWEDLENCPFGDFEESDRIYDEIRKISVYASRSVYPGHKVLLFDKSDGYSYEYVEVDSLNLDEIRRKIQNTVNWVVTHEVEKAIELLKIK